MNKLVRKIIEGVESSPIGLWLWLASFSSIIIIRILVENWLVGFKNRSGLFLFYEFTHTFLFFLVSYLIFVILLSKTLRVGIKKVSNFLIWGFLIIITPPIIDYIISGGKGYWSFYEFDGLAGLLKRFFTFYGSTPEIGMTYGPRIEVALALIFILFYSFLKLQSRQNSRFEILNSKQIQNPNEIKSKSFNHLIFKFLNLFRISDLGFRIYRLKKNIINILKSLAITFTTYIIFFVLGTFPSYVAILIKGFSKGFFNVGEIDVAQMFLTPTKIFSREISDIVSTLNIKMSLIYSLVLILLLIIGCWLFSRQKTLSFAANARYPQLIYHGGLLVIGIELAYIFTGIPIEINFFNFISFLVLLSSVFLAWLASLIPNDIYDLESDKLTSNKNRPLVQKVFSLEEYKTLGWILFLTSILLAAIVNFKIALLLIVYQAIAWIYSSPPFRLKRFALISTFVSSIASLLILFSGYILVSPAQNIQSLPFSIIILLIIGYTLALPIKDFKDIEGDKKNGIWTIPVLFGEYWGKIIIGSGLFLLFMLSVIIFNEFRLFWWAFLTGTISFWIILSAGENKKVVYKRLPWWILGVVIFYGLVIVRIVFF